MTTKPISDNSMRETIEQVAEQNPSDHLNALVQAMRLLADSEPVTWLNDLGWSSPVPTKISGGVANGTYTKVPDAKELFAKHEFDPSFDKDMHKEIADGKIIRLSKDTYILDFTDWKWDDDTVLDQATFNYACVNIHPGITDTVSREPKYAFERVFSQYVIAQFYHDICHDGQVRISYRMRAIGKLPFKKEKHAGNN